VNANFFPLVTELLRSRALLVFETISESAPIRALKRSRFIKSGGRRIKDLFFPPSPAARYTRWLRTHLENRARAYDTELEPGLLSFVSTVWDTPVDFLKPLAESVLDQRGGRRFEWVVLDNGSTRPETISYLQELGDMPGVRLLKAPENRGIIGGMRLCLESATGRYIVPVDSDDLLYPDCARILTSHIHRSGYPPLLYTDEDKLVEGHAVLPFFKPDWDPVLFANCCYIAHLCAIDRERGLGLGVYTDPATNGSHDWDTFVRFVNAGHVPVHVPEVTYSWRAHPQSTSANIASKSYIHDSQRSVLGRWLAAREHPERYRLEPSPLFSGTPDWRIRRLPMEPAPLHVVILSETAGEADLALSRLKRIEYPIESFTAIHPVDGGISRLRECADALFRDGSFVAFIDAGATIEGSQWPWESLGIFELFPDTAIVGGRLIEPGGSLVSAGGVLGFGRSGCESPDRGRPVSESGYFANVWKQRSVSSVSSQFAVADAGFVKDFLGETGPEAGLRFLGAWLGAFARSRGRRIVYTPFLTASVTEDWEAPVSQEERKHFLETFGAHIPDYQVYSPHMSLDPSSAYLPALPEALHRHLKSLFPFST